MPAFIRKNPFPRKVVAFAILLLFERRIPDSSSPLFFLRKRKPRQKQ